MNRLEDKMPFLINEIKWLAIHQMSKTEMFKRLGISAHAGNRMAKRFDIELPDRRHGLSWAQRARTRREKRDYVCGI